jgi:haloalkane dehalogenase
MAPVPEEYSAPAKEAYKTLPVIKAAELEACFRGTCEGAVPGVPGFLYWRKFCAESQEVFRPGEVIDFIGNASSLTNGEKEAFNAPYPDETYASGAFSLAGTPVCGRSGSGGKQGRLGSA